eukprot:1095736-Prymnesium_polylepis.2
MAALRVDVRRSPIHGDGCFTSVARESGFFRHPSGEAHVLPAVAELPNGTRDEMEAGWRNGRTTRSSSTARGATSTGPSRRRRCVSTRSFTLKTAASPGRSCRPKASVSRAPTPSPLS